jgi:VWFA-related protein
VVLVPVVVRNAAGQAVAGLKKTDFELRDRHQLESLASFTEEKMAAPNPAPPATPRASAASAAAAPVLPDRFTAYIFDDVHIRFGDLSQVRDAVWRNIQESLGPNERAAVFTTSRRIFTEFTADREALRAAMYRITPTPVYRPTSAPCGELSFLHAYRVSRGDRVALQQAISKMCTGGGPGTASGKEMQAEMAAARAVRLGERETELALDALRDVARRMSALAGRRSIVLISHGFLITDEQQGVLAQTMDWALRSGAVIHTLNSSGLLTGWEMGESGYDDDTVGPAGSFYRDQARNEGAMSLRTLADGTGGDAIENNNDYAGSVRRLAVPPETRYVLAFTPRNLKCDGSFHPLAIRLANPQYKTYTVRPRRGYTAPKQAEGLTDAAAREMEDAVFARSEVHDLPVDMRTEVSRTDGIGPELTISAEIDLSFLHYRPVDGRSTDDVTAVMAVFDSDGNFLDGKQQILKLRLRDETQTAMEQRPRETLQTSFALTPGAYVARLVVRSTESQTLTATSKVVEIR